MKKIKKYIIFFTILLIAIIIALVVMTTGRRKINSEFKVGEYGDEDENYEENHVIEETVKKVDNRTEYYIVKNIIDKYFEYIDMTNTNPSTELERLDSDFAIETISGMLSPKYIEEFNITNEKLINDLQKYKNCDYNIEEMYTKEKTIDITTYLINVNVSQIGNLYFIVGVDFENNIFEIYGDEYVKKYKYNEDTQTLKNFEINNIEKNSFNTYTGEIVTDQDIAISYFNDYKYNMLNNVEKAYNSLDEEYRNKRFGSLEEFSKYIQENIDIFRDISINEYICNNKGDYTEYVCRDQNEYVYIFKETAIMDYTLQLDTYTIPSEDFIKEYTDANVKEKVTMNIQKFMDMINNHDYKSAYNVLNQEFKDKYFKTEEEFKQYIKNTYFEINRLGLKEFTDENGVYVYTGIMRDGISEDVEYGKDMNIVMRLKSGTEFEMSFEVYL